MASHVMRIFKVTVLFSTFLTIRSLQPAITDVKVKLNEGLQSTLQHFPALQKNFQEFSTALTNTNIDLFQELRLTALLSNLNQPVALPTTLEKYLNLYDLSFSLTTANLIEIFAAAFALLLVKSLSTDNNKLSSSSTVYGDKQYRYDPVAAEQYFSKRPNVVVNRATELFAASSGFGLALLFDFLTGKLTDPQREKDRADSLVVLLTKLGPTFIKIGQSLSIRADLVRPIYLAALAQLQDRVPAFPTSEARKIIEQELGVNPDELFIGLGPSTQVVAAASLGQVYQVQYKNQQVAVKVQRPNILERVALDMYLLRKLMNTVKGIFNFQSDLVGVVDDWGRGFVDELDYRREADNANTFMKSIKNTPLDGVVFAPEVIPSASTQRVLTTLWVDGERLEQCKKDDMLLMCSLAMNTYLSMMLDSPILHSDPHPGNLRRTPDGRLCIMDWGLVTSLRPDLQLTMIEHIAHLTSRDYKEVPADLIKLGFVPPGKEKEMLEGNVAEVLSGIYGAWAQGGGAAAINVNQVFNQLNGLSDQYGNLFQLPPYFAYIARAFGVLEGIGITADPNYSILSQCLPYVSQRLLTDAKAGDSLKTFIFGPEKNNVNRVIDPDRVELLMEGFATYGNTVASIESKMSKLEQLELIAEQIADLVLGKVSTVSASQQTPEMVLTPLQSLLLEEVAKIISASTRSQWSALRQQSGRLPSGRTILGQLVDPLGIFRHSPLDVLVEVNDQDKIVVDSTNRLLNLLQQQQQSKGIFTKLSSSMPNNNKVEGTENFGSLENMSKEEFIEMGRLIASKVWDRRRNVQFIGTNLLVTMLKQTLQRVG